MDGKKRRWLAAVGVKFGKLTSWKAKSNSTVKALLLMSSGKLLVVGGNFSKINSKAKLTSWLPERPSSNF